MKCIITGCALVNESLQEWVAGDLFDSDEFYVFNGNFDVASFRASWLKGPPSYSKVLAPWDYWERRGVFIIPKEMANLNQAALAYIGETT